MTLRRTTTIRLEEDIWAGLEEVKQRDGIPHSEQIRRAVEQWLVSKQVRKANRSSTVRSKPANR